MTADPIRVVRLYGLPPVRSQSVYHAVAYEATPAGPDTILLITPNAPYVSIGYHQQADVELDLSACRQRGLPIVRREVGGGAVYLDGDQVFVNWVMRQRRLPAILSDRYALYVAPLLSTYRAFGIQAEYRPINDVHVAGRKIGGTGAARIGEAELLVGSLMLDFDMETMAAVLRVPSAKMRDKVAGALRDYMTTMRRELGTAPDRDEVAAKYLEECARILQRPLVEAELTPAEQARTTALKELMASPAWIFRKDGRARVGVRVHAGVARARGRPQGARGLGPRDHGRVRWAPRRRQHRGRLHPAAPGRARSIGGPPRRPEPDRPGSARGRRRLRARTKRSYQALMISLIAVTAAATPTPVQSRPRSCRPARAPARPSPEGPRRRPPRAPGRGARPS
jgi:lipoate-protein ligase A